jgi:signal transduction histidine kinase
MNLARKPAMALMVAILVVLAVSAFLQLPEEVDFGGGTINLTQRGLALMVVTIFAFGGAVATALWPSEPNRPPAKEEVAAPQADELFHLAREINRQVAEENEAHVAAIEQIRQRERLTTVEHLAAGIAHELGTPLSVTSARAELIATTDLPRDEVIHSARVIVEQADRMAGIIRQLLDFSRRGVGRRADVDLREVVATTVGLISGIANKAKVEVVCKAGAEAMPVYVDPNTMQQALTNIALNGIQAMPRGGQLRIRIESRHMQPPPGVSDTPATYQCVIIEDDGVGIPPDHVPQLFEPLFTTKRVGEGTGLGLPVASGIVAEHGGWISVESVEGRGSRFSIMLPRPPAAAGRREVAA